MKADRYIFTASLCGLFFLLGLSAGESSPKQCPTVDGMTVISSSADRHGESCTYQPVSPAHRKHTRRI